jgi:hypothetical protein
MISIDISGIVYECDGTQITASANGRTFGPALVASAKVLENGSVYLVLGVLNVVLTKEAFDILLGVAPLPVTEATAPEAVEDPVIPATKKRTRRSVTPAE